MTFPPDIRRIDPEAEAERLARERLDPPGREWGIRHPDGTVTVRSGRCAFPDRTSAETELASCVQGCDECGIQGGAHTLVYRDRQPWREAP